ncbi:MAG: hypothetical protein KDD33_00320 [Bdellovibrionales bacterium]|nr:hypothetical protein [Bdellovibrionales bacterium]
MGKPSVEKKAFFRISFWTIILIGFLGASNGLFIVYQMGTGIEIPFQRKLASVEEEIEPAKEKLAPVVKIDCKQLDVKRHLLTQASTTRFVIENCKKVGSFKNQTNNNQGDIFPMPTGGWTSDFVSLSHGKNILSMDLDGKKHSVEITREKGDNPSETKAL